MRNKMGGVGGGSWWRAVAVQPVGGIVRITSASNRVAFLGVAALVAVSLGGCGDTPTDVALEVVPQLAKGGGGKGGGPKPDPVPVIMDLAGGMVAVAQDGQYGTDAPDLFEASGQPHGPGSGCEDAANPDCFWSELALGAGYLAAGGLAGCSVPRRMSNDNRDHLLGKLDSPSQARESFDIEVDRDRGTARLRTFWYEDDPTVRYGYFVDSNDVSETGGPDSAPWQMTFTDGELSMYGLGDKALKCDWQGSITLTLTPVS